MTQFRPILILLLLVASGRTVSAAPKADDTEISYTPEIFGVVKTRFEVSAERGEYRFSVRNSRLGARGLIGPNTRYGIQMELSSEGKFSVLDSYLTFLMDRFELTVGQQRYRFSTELDRGTSTSLFANASFLAQFITTYHGSTLSGTRETDFVKSIGARDIGALASYRLPVDFPVRLLGGLFNGSGANNPEWSESLNVVGRLEAGNRPGIGGAVSTYLGHTPVRTHIVYPSGANPEEEAFKQKLRMWGSEFFWAGKRFLVEAELAQRLLFTDDGQQTLTTGLVQGYYRFPVGSGRVVEHVSPTARWDIGRGIDYLNEVTRLHDRFDAQRVTVGVNFGIAPGKLRSELRLNYEKFLFDAKPGDLAENKLLHDKFTVEFVASF